VDQVYNIKVTYMINIALQMSGQCGTEAALASTWRAIEQVTSAIWDTTIGEKSPSTSGK
jgi:hypothetical protein